jgi:hypothetical protein
MFWLQARQYVLANIAAMSAQSRAEGNERLNGFVFSAFCGK